MPSLQQGFEIFCNWQTILFTLSIYLLTQFVRTIIENWSVTKTHLAGSWIWGKLCLPFGPVGTGMILAAIAKKFPWPPALESHSSKMMYAAVCGLFCCWVYDRVRDWLNVAADRGNGLAMKVMKRTPSTPPPPMDDSDSAPKA